VSASRFSQVLAPTCLLSSLATHRLPDCLSLLSSQEVNMTSLFHRLWTEEKGQDIAEYAVMLALILVLVVGTIRLVGSNANNVFSSVASSVQ
jgi:Flp pilus assembly pilin Flp